MELFHDRSEHLFQEFLILRFDSMWSRTIEDARVSQVVGSLLGKFFMLHPHDLARTLSTCFDHDQSRARSEDLAVGMRACEGTSRFRTSQHGSRKFGLDPGRGVSRCNVRPSDARPCSSFKLCSCMPCMSTKPCVQDFSSQLHCPYGITCTQRNNRGCDSASIDSPRPEVSSTLS